MLLGCRSGAACPFRHEVLDTAHQSTTAVQHQPARRSQPSHPPQQSVAAVEAPIAQTGDTDAHHNAALNTSRITKRPVPQSQLADPREYQVSQVRRRFAPVQEKDENGSAILSFRLRPSDPDFPFDMDALHCTLRVPPDYPNGGKPTLRVTNPNMERGYQINIENGFDVIAAASGSKTLLACLNALDRQLEGLLSSQKADTIKIVSHSTKQKASEPKAPSTVVPNPPKVPQTFKVAQRPAKAKTYSPAEIQRAKEIREAETRQLEARLGRLPQYFKSSDGLEYVVPIQPAKKAALPVELQAVKAVRLIVPMQYNLSPCRIHLVGVSGHAVGIVEQAFANRAAETSEQSLLNHLNYLSQNMHLMAKLKVDEKKDRVEAPAQLFPAERSEAGSKHASQAASNEADRPHIVTIPRPPEWRILGERDSEASESSSDSSDASDDEDTHDSGDQAASTAADNTSVEKGILVSFPHFELHGVELLEVAVLNITVKCDRCKDTKDIKGLQDTTKGNHTLEDSCKKCAFPFSMGYRGELLHANSIRAGYLDLEGCTVVDMLPSTFIPTCAECSTTYPRNGVTSVRGDTSMAFCRECHRKMNFGLPEIKFLRVSAKTERASHAPLRKKRTENLGIVAGQELTNRGRCSHYKKSYRWFRFSCCSKVFPCDRCHDQAADHAIEHANRMICGFCSREQNYRPNDCGICHAWLTMKPGKGFWEGGQGTRDRVKMSRKDPRKYKRIGGSKAAT